MPTGITEFDTKSGIHVVQLDHWADPLKRSPEWEKQAHQGLDERSFRKEYKRDWTVASGKPIYEGYFDRERHVAKQPYALSDEAQEILLGFDFGRQPACVWARLTPRGCLRVLRENVAWNGRGPVKMRDTLELADDMQIINSRYYPGRSFDAYVDFAGYTKSESLSISCVDVLQREKYNIQTVQPGPVGWQVRKQAMFDALNQMRGDEPLLQLDPGCTMLIEGFESAYKYREVGPEGAKVFVDEAEKNAWSHIMNALEYVVGTVFYGMFGDIKTVEPMEPEDVPVTRKRLY
jgi:hypothetical protein